MYKLIPSTKYIRTCIKSRFKFLCNVQWFNFRTHFGTFYPVHSSVTLSKIWLICVYTERFWDRNNSSTNLRHSHKNKLCTTPCQSRIISLFSCDLMFLQTTTGRFRKPDHLISLSDVLMFYEVHFEIINFWFINGYISR